MNPDRKTILCIDDYEPAAAGWCLFLQAAGYLVQTAYDPQEGLHLFATSTVDLVLLDYAMPEINGAELAATMKRIKPHVPIVMLSGFCNIPEPERASTDALLVKGEDPAFALQKIQELLGVNTKACSNR